MTRAELLAVATRAFAANGYRGTPLGLIAENLGVRKASLFHHVKNKEALYLEVLGQILSGLEVLVSEAKLGEGEFLLRLDRLGALVVDFLASQPAAARLLYREMMDEGPFFSQGGREHALRTLEMAKDFLENGMVEGEIPRQDTPQLLMSIVGLHFTWFALDNLSTPLGGKDVFGEEGVLERKLALREQIRRLCGAPV
jgi:AcrR family transcriptional regulator